MEFNLKKYNLEVIQAHIKSEHIQLSKNSHNPLVSSGWLIRICKSESEEEELGYSRLKKDSLRYS